MLGAVALVAYGISRFPDSRERIGAKLDDALFKGGVRAAWLAVAVGVLGVLVVWLLV